MYIPKLVHKQPYSCGFDITADYSPLLLVSFITNIIILDNISKIYLIQLVLKIPNKPFVVSSGRPRGGIKVPYGPGLKFWVASSDQQLRCLCAKFIGFLAKLPTFPLENNQNADKL